MRVVGSVTQPFASDEVVLIPPQMPHCWQFDYDDADDMGHIANVSVMFSDRFLDGCSEIFPGFYKHFGTQNMCDDRTTQCTIIL